MGLDIGEEEFGRTLDAVYDAVVTPTGWRPALTEIGRLFDAGFVDVCTWTHDRAHVSGLAEGLDERDYEDVFLGVWFNRNVWSQSRPVRVAGEVLSTRQMMAREDLARSEMYHDYLQARGLHEGLRLALWVDEDGLGDLSLLRPWSLGAFGPSEVTLGQKLLPHVQRAAAVTRRLRQADFNLDAEANGTGSGEVAALAFDDAGRPCWLNAAAETLLRRGDPLRRVGQDVAALTPEATRRLEHALARAGGRAGALPEAGAVLLPRAEGIGTATAIVQPLRGQRHWTAPRQPTALLLLRMPDGLAQRGSALQRMFGLTDAETQVALDLLQGLTLAEAAQRSGRSRNTLRSHLARLMEKTGTSRQVDLVRLLDDVAAVGSAAPGADPFRTPFGRSTRS